LIQQRETIYVTITLKQISGELAFALEARLQTMRRSANLGQGEELDKELSELADNLSEEDRNEALQQARFGQTGLPEEEMSLAEDTLDNYYIKQIKTLACGKQFADKSLEYLADALRGACDYNLK